MIALFADGSEKQVEMINRQPDLFGSILTPTNNRAYLSQCAGVIGIDNGAFAGFDERKFCALLAIAPAYKERVRFVAAPDVVARATETLELFQKWQPVIASYSLPVALVAQDGMIESIIPWDSLSAIFIGGSTEYKLSRDVDAIILKAKQLSKWTHVGRVSTKRRIDHFRVVGVDSIDSVAFSRWPRHVANFQRWSRQALLFENQIAI